MFKKFTNACVNVVQKYLPDAFIFCIILTIVVFLAALPVTGMKLWDVADAWGKGIWSLLKFSMQMALVLVLGTALATAPPVKRAINAAAGVPKSPTSAIVFITVVSMIACWLNWGFGLVVGAILAKEIAKKVKGVDYRLLIASAYSGFVIWHAGFSGSIPLQLASYTDKQADRRRRNRVYPYITDYIFSMESYHCSGYHYSNSLCQCEDASAA